ncbi:acyl-CoA dehydrogenase family protein [Gordonia sp. NPDC003424]
MSDLTADLVDTTASIIDRVGVDTATPATGADTALWSALLEAGFVGIDVPEEFGGSGAGTDDALAVLAMVARSGAVTPLVEHGILAAHLAGRAGFDLDGRTATIAIADERCTARTDGDRLILDGVVSEVVHTDLADTLVLLLPEPVVAVVDLSGSGVVVRRGTDLLGASVSEVAFDGAATIFHAKSPMDGDEVRQRGALAYAVALSAAAEAARDATLRYTTERNQFGRPLTKFQAIQQRLAVMAAQTTMMHTATQAAIDAIGTDPQTARGAVAAAKVVCSRHAHEVAAAAHQLHGAIGFTSEHALGRFTTSLWTWRDRHGTERDWAEVLAGQILDDGVDLWDVVVGLPAGDSLPSSLTDEPAERENP